MSLLISFSRYISFCYHPSLSLLRIFKLGYKYSSSFKIIINFLFHLQIFSKIITYLYIYLKSIILSSYVNIKNLLPFSILRHIILLEQKFAYPKYDYFIIFTLYKTENTKICAIKTI